MDDYDLVDMNLMDLDLNLEPRDPPPLHRVARYDSRLNELENANDRIEERIRRLEAVTARARQRQRWREERNYLELRDIVSGVSIANSGRSGGHINDNVESISERGKSCKRDNSHLVSKALEMDSTMVKKPDNKDGGSFYDCNICLDEAREPILTCCGHLFCWSCFYQVLSIDSISKECPVCKGEVLDSTVIPIYGNGDSEPMRETETGLIIPPRPKASRVESVRQQRLTQGLPHVPFAEALRQIRISIGIIEDQARQQEGGANDILNLETFPMGQNELGGVHRFRIHQVSRVLSESVASLTSLSYALSNAERLMEDLETVINSQLLRNNALALAIDANQPPELTADINAALPIAPSSQPTQVSVSAINLLRARASSGVSLPAAARRRSIISRISDLDYHDPRETRRRRLN